MRLWIIALVAFACGRSTPRIVTTIDGDVLALAADASSIYATVVRRDDASIVRVPKSGGPNVTVVAHTGVARGIAIDDGTLYWCELDEARVGHVKSARAADGGAPNELARLDTTPVGIAADDRELYVLSVGTWSTTGTLDTTRGSLVAVSKTGGARVLADHLVRPSSLGLDAASVMWDAGGVRWILPKTGGTPTQMMLAPLPADGPFVVVLRDRDAVYRAASTDTGSTITVVLH